MKTGERNENAEFESEARLFEAVAALASAQEIGLFIRDLCTPAELQAMADRWRVVRMLRAGKPYREIHDLTGVSVTTVGRVARYLEHGNGGYQLAIDRLSNL